MCNHGHQDGIHCICDEGWISSGLHRDNPLKFNWCDSRVSDSYDNSGAPKKLSKGLEVFLIVVSISVHIVQRCCSTMFYVICLLNFVQILSIVNFALLVSWLYVLTKLVCPKMFNKSTVWCRVMSYYCYSWCKK